jgi:hypothetical protein
MRSRYYYEFYVYIKTFFKFIETGRQTLWVCDNNMSIRIYLTSIGYTFIHNQETGYRTVT